MTEQSKREKADKAIEVINAWAGGVPLQYRDIDGDYPDEWDDYRTDGGIPDVAHWDYRIKPKTRYILHFDELAKESNVLGYVFKTKASAQDTMMALPGVYSHIEEIPNE
jgi:hypothetical protein